MRDRDIQKYQEAYLADYGFERVMVHYRKKMVMERLRGLSPKVVVEVGCGAESYYQSHLEGGGVVKSWVIVEPSQTFCQRAQDLQLPNCHVICDFFENAAPDLESRMNERPDLVLCSGLLHEVPSADLLLKSVVQIMHGETILHVNVPNANSFHRELAIKMGLMTNPKTMSERNLQLLQHRVYDLPSLMEDMEKCGLEVIRHGGYLVKPFTHAQMEALAPVLGSDVLDGLFQLGIDHPEWASEIYVEARRRTL